MEIKMQVERGEVEIEVEVLVELSPSYRGARGRFGEQLEPDEAASGEVVGVVPEGIMLSEGEALEAVSRAFAQAHDNELAALEYAQECARDEAWD